MDVTDENCSPVIVTNGGEFIVELLHSFFSKYTIEISLYSMYVLSDSKCSLVFRY